MKPTPPADHMLAVRFGHLGDVVLTTGPLRLFHEDLGLRLTVLTKPAWAPVFAGNPHVETVVPFDPSGLSTGDLAARFRELAKEFPGHGLLDLHGIPRTRLLAALWKGPVVRYSKFSLQRRLFLVSGGRLSHEGLCRHNVPQRYAMALYGKRDVPAQSLLRPEIHLTEAELREADGFLAATFGRAGVRPVALHPFAAHALKTKPASFWTETAALLEAQGIPPLILGVGTPLLPDRPWDCTNRTTLRQTCALLARCRVLVTGDSGPMHLATAVGTPVVALFGPTTREWGFYPCGPRDLVLERALPCRPCSLHGGFHGAKGGGCLDVSPARMIERLSDFLHGDHDA